MASFSFDSSAVEPQQSNSPIPAGTYLAHVTESDLKPLKSGNGMGLSLTFQILDGEHKNRKIWMNLNVQHSNPTAQQIGQSQLSALCHAVQVQKMRDTNELHSKPVKIKVKIRVDAQYGDKNEVTGFEAATGASPAAFNAKQPAAAPAAAPWQASNSAATAPWA